MESVQKQDKNKKRIFFQITKITDDELCKTMGRQGREHILKNLDYRDISKKMIDITKERLDLK